MRVENIKEEINEKRKNMIGKCKDLRRRLKENGF